MAALETNIKLYDGRDTKIATHFELGATFLLY